MRKTLVVGAMLLLFLISCASPPSTVQPPDNTDMFRVVRASIMFVGFEPHSTRTVFIDINSELELPLFGDTFLYLEFDSHVLPETLRHVAGAQLVNPQLVRIPLDSSTSRVIIPSTLTNIAGAGLAQEYSLGFRHESETQLPAELLSCYPEQFPELRLEGATDFTLNKGETFVLTQNWPLPREPFEASIEKAFAGAEYRKEWLDDRTLAITIDRLPHEYGGYELSLQGIEDTFGYTHHEHCRYTFSLVPAVMVNSVTLATGRVFPQSVPMAVSGATSMDAQTNRVELFRRHQLASGHDAVDQRFTLDLTTGRIVGDIRSESAGFPDSVVAVFATIAPYLAPHEFHARSALSPWGDIVAAIYHNWQEDLSYLLLIETATGNSEHFPISSRHVWDGGSNPPSPPIWFPDGTGLVYDSLDDEGIYTVDIRDGKEARIVEGSSLPLFYSPAGVLFFYSSGEYYMLDSAGDTIKWDTADSHPRLVTWLDEDRALISRERWTQDDECYVFYVKDNLWEYVSTGTAFDYDSLSGSVYLLDKAR